VAAKWGTTTGGAPPSSDCVCPFVSITSSPSLVRWRAKEKQNHSFLPIRASREALRMSFVSEQGWQMEARLVDAPATKFPQEAIPAPSDTSAPQRPLPGPVSAVLGRGKRPRAVSRTQSEPTLDRPAPTPKKLKTAAPPKPKDPTKEAIEAEVS
jgi:hypothetical protein